jgi:putative transposase
LSKRIQHYATSKETLTRYDIQKDLPKMKTSTAPWLKEVNSQSLQSSLDHLDKAYIAFFRKLAKFPRYKSKKKGKQSFEIPQSTKVDFDAGTVSVPKIKGIKAIFHRRFEGKVKTCTVTKVPSGKYFISILVETLEEVPAKPSITIERAIGIDLGIKRFLATSNGIIVENPKHLRKSLKNLAKEQRCLSKKKKGSNGYAKQRIKVARVHEHIANQRKDFLDKVTKQLVNDKQVDTICLETLDVQSMQNGRVMSREINDAAWGTFNRMLEYKCEWYGKNLLRIGRFEPSSKLCPKCGVVNKGLTLKQRSWTCPSCSAFHKDRDELAACNIRDMSFHNLIGREPTELTPVELEPLQNGNISASSDVETGSLQL